MGTRTNKQRICRLFHGRFHGRFLWRSAEEQAWLDLAPVGREFGSPDYERLEQLDSCPFDVFGDMMLIYEWLFTPHPTLDGMTPDDCARSEAGLQKALDLLAGLKLGAAAGLAITSKN
ncbi:antitoxin Xre/MbcA/ParS toxin-binding domain-containing protein [Rhodoferax ferrireducens]|nr:antitoxin Xre/MbcA/ParS toxin-binding domain-containing protein [Rhodoferax ferrireducens]